MFDETVVRAVNLLMEQHEKLMNCVDSWERDFLSEEAERGPESFKAACEAVFGAEMDRVLSLAIEQANELNKHAYATIDTLDQEEEKECEILVAQERAKASKMLQSMLHADAKEFVTRCEKLARSARRYAKAIQKYLDPDGSLCHRNS